MPLRATFIYELRSFFIYRDGSFEGEERKKDEIRRYGRIQVFVDI